MKHSSVTVILPTFNEKENVIPLIGAIKKYTPSNTTILVVDDNSPDGTAKKVQSFIRSNQSKGVKLIVRTTHRGLTNSLNAGISKATSDIVVWMDCDFSHPPEVIPKLLSEINTGVDVVVAGRIQNRGLSLCINSIAMFLFGSDITDYTTGFLAIKTSVVHRIPLRGDYGEYCIDLLVRAKRLGYTLKEIPYVSPRRKFGTSKTVPLRQGYGYIMTILKLLWTSGN